MPLATESVVETVEQLRSELARVRREFDSAVKRIEEQLSALTPAATKQPAPSPVAAPEPKPVPELSPETIAIIAAAVTSFLGKKVKIRHARRIDYGSTSWAQQGRAIIQASHNLAR